MFYCKIIFSMSCSYSFAYANDLQFKHLEHYLYYDYKTR